MLQQTDRWGVKNWPGVLALALGLALAGSAWAQADDAAAPAEAAAETPADAPAAEQKTPREPLRAETPEACFEAAKTAFNDRDWRGFVDCVSPPRRDALIGQMAATFAMMAQAPEADPKVVELVRKHLPADFDPMQVLMSDDSDSELARLSKGMRNSQRFFAEAMETAFALEYPDPDKAATITELTELQVQDEKAHGMVHLAAPEREQPTTDRWNFERFDGAWYLTMQ